MNRKVIIIKPYRYTTVTKDTVGEVLYYVTARTGEKVAKVEFINKFNRLSRLNFFEHELEDLLDEPRD